MASQTSKPPSKPVLARNNFPGARFPADFLTDVFVYGSLIISDPTGKSSIPGRNDSSLLIHGIAFIRQKSYRT